MEPRSAALPPTIGRFRIEAILGSGGMGDVYKAIDPTLHRTVAVKTVRPDRVEPDALARLYREAQACARLQHPNIVTVFEAGETDGVVYIAMEYLKGENLASRLRRGGLSFEAKLRILVQVLEALHHAHSENVIHRDIKPSNIHLQPDGSAKLLDFGLARMAHVDTMTTAGVVMGTLHYASPEQLNAERVDSRTDIYSTGALAYEMISGRLPFDGEHSSAAAVVLKVMSEMPPPMGAWCSENFPELERLVARAMAKLPDDRYETADHMRMALVAFMASAHDAIASAGQGAPPDAATSTSLHASASKRPSRQMAWLSAAAAAIAITAVTAVVISQVVGPSATIQPSETAVPLSAAPVPDASSTGTAAPAPPELPAQTQTPSGRPEPPTAPPLATAASAAPIVTAKQLFYAAAGGPAAPGDQKGGVIPLGLRYRIIQQSASGAELEVNPDTTFRSGDRVRFAFEANTDGYLYVVQEGSSGRWDVLFPNPQLNGGRNAVRRLEQYQVPPEGWFEFDDNPGIERAFVYLTKEPFDQLPGFTQPVRRAETVTAAVIQDIDRDIRSRDLKWVVEKEQSRRDPNATPTEATYIVNRDDVGRAVAAVIQLKHGR